MQVEEYLRHDDRAVIPLGSTEQHAYLSLSTDSILAERVAVEAAQPIGVAVFPVVAYGITPYFMAYPGTISLRVNTYMQIIHDILESLTQHGFKRIVIVNGHGGNTPAQSVCSEFMRDHPQVRLKWQDWWNAATYVGQSASDRSGGVTCIVDGELSLDPPGECGDAVRAETADRADAHPAIEPTRGTHLPGRRQLCRPVSTIG